MYGAREDITEHRIGQLILCSRTSAPPLSLLLQHDRSEAALATAERYDRINLGLSGSGRIA